MTTSGDNAYDKQVAFEYESVRTGERHWELEDAWMKEHLPKRHGQRILDLPVGTGRFFTLYESSSAVVGVDISASMLEQAQNKVTAISSPNMTVSLEIGDVTNLHAFADMSFDISVVFRLWHLLMRAQVENGIAEICRVTRTTVLSQSYATPTSSVTWIDIPLQSARRVVGAVKRRSPRNRQASNSDETQRTPWAHIQAYRHDQRWIDRQFRKNGFAPVSQDVIDLYDGARVVATEYRRLTRTDG